MPARYGCSPRYARTSVKARRNATAGCFSSATASHRTINIPNSQKPPPRWKMPGNTLHLGGGFWEFGIFIVRCDAVADEKQPAVAFLLAFTDGRAYRGA